MDPSASILSTQYNNKLISIGELGKIRGSGQFSTDYPLSSNYPLGKSLSLWNDDKKFPTEDFNLSSQMPVAQKVGRQWQYKPENSLQGSDPYVEFALKSTKQVPSAFLNTFFSRDNVKYLGNRIVQEVKKITGHDIKKQNEDAILIYMRANYNSAMEGFLPQPNEPHGAHANGGVNISLIDRITRVNQAVLQQCVKEILSSMKMYIQYTKDASSMPIPLERPTNASNKGGNVLSENIGLYSSHNDNRSIQSYNLKDNVIN